MTENSTTSLGSKGEFMDRGIYATVEHRKLMELKNCGVLSEERLEQLAQSIFIGVRAEIKDAREMAEDNRGFFARLFSLELPIRHQVVLMFPDRATLTEHLVAVDVPTHLCPITEESKEQMIFASRAEVFGESARKVLDMFKRHHDVVVDSDRSLAIEWILQNAGRIRLEFDKRGI